MRRLFHMGLISILAGACGDKEGTGSSQDGGGTGSTDSGATDDGAGSDDSGSGGGSGGTATDTGDGGDTGTSGPSEVTISGIVQDFVLMGPIADAALSVFDMPGFETTSDMDGNYAIEGLTPNSEVFVILDPSTDYFGGVRPVMVGPEDDDNVQLGQISRSFIEGQFDLIVDNGAVDPELDKAIIIVRLLQNTATGAVVEMDPPPADDTYYAPDSGGSAILNQNTVEFALLPVVVFYNLDPVPQGTISFTVTHPERTCTILHPDFPLLGEHISLVDVDCPPV